MKRTSSMSQRGPEGDSMAAMMSHFMNPGHCRKGDLMQGVIASVSPKAILVDIGGKCDAAVVFREVEQMSPAALSALRPGQPVSVYVVETGEENGVVLVSLARAAQEGDWAEAARLLEHGNPVTLKVIEANRGGVIVALGRLRGFVPSSQLLPGWRTLQNSEDPEHRWDGLIGKMLTLRVIEVAPERNRLILSERGAADPKSRKRTVLEQLQVGSIYKGTVSNVVPFGAFVNVNGVDGLVHISEISWRRVNHPSEVVQAGQEVEVVVLDIEVEHERLSLSLKRRTPDPWELIARQYAEGQLVEVQIVNLTTFGAFATPVDIPELEGLIHISELSERPVVRPDEVVKVGERRVARIISLRPAERRVAFSLKQVVPGESPETENWKEILDEVQREETVAQPVE